MIYLFFGPSTRIVQTIKIFLAAAAAFITMIYPLATSRAATTYTERLTIINNCGDNAWMWIIPPGPDIAEQQSQFWETVNGATRVCKNSDNPCATRNYQWKVEIPATSGPVNFKIPDTGSASNKIYFNLGCNKTSGDFAEWGDCKIGGKFGLTLLGNDMSGSNTWFEATWGCKKGSDCVPNPSDPSQSLTAVDWMDISAVDGYTVPMTLTLASSAEAASHNCQFNDGTAWNGVEDAGFLDFASCPRENSKTLWTVHSEVAAALKNPGLSLLTVDPDTKDNVNCVAPYKWFSSIALGDQTTGLARPVTAGTGAADLNEVNWYGCKGKCGGTSGTASCTCPECSNTACLKGPYGNQTFNVAETNYVRSLKAMGLKAYSWQYDDNYGNKHCDQGVHVTITLCPLKSGQKPYDPLQEWVFDSGNNRCKPAEEGEPNTYGSYYECVTTNAKYKLVQDHGVYYCMPDASGPFISYAECSKHTNSGSGLR